VRVTRHPTLAESLTEVGDRRIVCHPAVVSHLVALRRRQNVDGVQIAQERAATDLLATTVRAGGLRGEGVRAEEWAGEVLTVASGGEVINGLKSDPSAAGLRALSWALHASKSARAPFLVA